MKSHMLLAVLTLALTGCSSPIARNEIKHLFILSGQSNMTGGLRKGFTRTVENALGSNNVAVVMSMRSGRGIRFWVKNYTPPAGVELSAKKMADNGSEYSRLIEAVTRVTTNHSFKTVSFIWMQGESDAGNRLDAVYAESFRKLINRLKSDLKLNAMYFVIGRISDAGLGGPRDEGWKRVRAEQVKLAEEDANGAWINTDDLNGPNNGVHYPSEKYAELGQRFAEKIVDLIKSRP